MARIRISSGSEFEELAGYSRAVVDGDMVYVSGTTGCDYASMTISDDVVEQAEQCLRNIEWALAEAGSNAGELLRIRVFLADGREFERVALVIGRFCRDARPANTTVLASLVDPRMKIEIEVTARKGAG